MHHSTTNTFINDPLILKSMASMHDVPVNDLIGQTAEELKKNKSVQPPEWASYVKTGAHKERPPVDQDWWYARSAAVLRSVGVLGPIGVAKLRKKYGGRKNRGHKPDKFVQASGNILRKVLQQLEASKLVAQKEKDVHKGRILTPQGRSLLDKAAVTLIKKTPKRGSAKPKVVEQKEDPQLQKEEVKQAPQETPKQE
jgi:small subunit ribosomal protein S19e